MNENTTGNDDSGTRTLFASVDTICMLADCFPQAEEANSRGLLCRGGDLSVPMLLAAYSRGIFPWFNEGDPILWWSPAPRCVMPLKDYHLPKRSVRYLRKCSFEIRLDTAFGKVIRACGGPREGKHGTWVTPDIIRSYTALFEAGFAHSVETWLDGELVGGLYGVALGRAFFGESMFHFLPEASRAALAALVALLKLRGITLLDCQQETPHIMAQGGKMLTRNAFERSLERALALQARPRDALGREYHLGMAPSRKRAEDTRVWRGVWPFLPWRTGYVHDAEQGWVPTPLRRAFEPIPKWNA